jgi:hypothetical protein
MPLGLLGQKPLVLQPGMIDAREVDTVLLVCRRRGDSG